jgi:hypothetical protein
MNSPAGRGNREQIGTAEPDPLGAPIPMAKEMPD